LPEKQYKEMLKAKHNAEYLTKLDKSFKQIKFPQKIFAAKSDDIAPTIEDCFMNLIGG